MRGRNHTHQKVESVHSLNPCKTKIPEWVPRGCSNRKLHLGGGPDFCTKSVRRGNTYSLAEYIQAWRQQGLASPLTAN